MRLFQCDRCGETTREADFGFTPFTVYEIRLSDIAYRDGFMLCGDCNKALKERMEAGDGE